MNRFCCTIMAICMFWLMAPPAPGLAAEPMIQADWAEGSQFWFNSNRLQVFEGRCILDHTISPLAIRRFMSRWARFTARTTGSPPIHFTIIPRECRRYRRR